MSVTLTNATLSRRIGRGLFLCVIYFNATGDASGGNVASGQVSIGQFDLKDDVYFFSAHARQNDAITQDLIGNIYTNEWSVSGSLGMPLIQCAKTAGWDDVSTASAGYFYNNPEKTVPYRYLGNPLTETPHISVVYGTNTNTKIYSVEFKFLVYRVTEFEAIQRMVLGAEPTKEVLQTLSAQQQMYRSPLANG